MTNAQMITWASRNGGDQDDFLDRLIWMARLQGQQDAYKEMSALSNQMGDAASVSSYPGGLKKRLKNDES
jgi:hypothetical protein